MDTQQPWQLLKAHLEEKKREIVEQILYYPPPIPACDAQYNYLLAERDRLTQAIGIIEDGSPNSSLDMLLAATSDLAKETAVAVQELLATV